MNHTKLTETEAQLVLDAAREEIDIIDSKIYKIFNESLGPELLKRFEVTQRVGKVKKDQNWPIHMPEREAKLLEKIESNLNEITVKKIARSFYNIVLTLSKEQQENL